MMKNGIGERRANVIIEFYCFSLPLTLNIFGKDSIDSDDSRDSEIASSEKEHQRR